MFTDGLFIDGLVISNQSESDQVERLLPGEVVRNREVGIGLFFEFQFS